MRERVPRPLMGGDAKQAERFRGDLEALGAAPGDRLGIALSGGPDSVALLLLAVDARHGEVEAATVDHGLRPESAEEAAFAGRLCQALAVPHAILRPAEPITGSVQAEARRVRYALLEGWRRERGLNWLLTAHHADDQAETLLMRLNRGAGPGGLSGIRAVNARVMRPLLGWRRAELTDIVRQAGIEEVADPSNEDERYDRARIRRQLGEADWIDPAALARSAGALGAVEEALAWATEEVAGERLRIGADEVTIDPSNLPTELKRRLLLRALRAIAPDADPRGEEMGRLLAVLEGGGTATLAGVKANGGATWRFAKAPPRKSGRGGGAGANRANS
ncbi:MAG: tRNA lysidine(34) synthetase TilS [Sphingosinicella sp.]